MISKNPKIIMNEKQFVYRLTAIKNRKTFYKNKYPYNLCYVNSDGRTSADCVNLVKAILNGYKVGCTDVGYYQRDLSNTGDCTEAELLVQCSDISQDFSNLGKTPEILYMKGHIGTYIGKIVENKYNVIECTNSKIIGNGVVYSWVDSDGTRRKEKGGAKNGKWSHHGKPTLWVSCDATEGSNSNEKAKVDYSNYPILKKGSTGKYVKILQQLLVDKGYDPKGVDGIFGNNTLIAVKNFQRDYPKNTDINGKKLAVDGCVGQLTWGALYK